MNRPEFTKDQEYWICDVIGHWYLKWKRCIAPEEHKLGYAKEELKNWLCSEKHKEFDFWRALHGFMTAEEFSKRWPEQIEDEE